MINKAKKIINSKEAKAVIDVAESAALIAGKAVYSFCKAIVNTVKKLK